VCSSDLSSLSHLFKKVLGKSFKQFQIEIKLERAEEYLRTIPGISVGEAANRVGYQDPLYFSRIFRKYKKVPPSALIGKDVNQGK